MTVTIATGVCVTSCLSSIGIENVPLCDLQPVTIQCYDRCVTDARLALDGKFLTSAGEYLEPNMDPDMRWIPQLGLHGVHCAHILMS